MRSNFEARPGDPNRQTDSACCFLTYTVAVTVRQEGSVFSYGPAAHFSVALDGGKDVGLLRENMQIVKQVACIVCKDCLPSEAQVTTYF